MIIMTTTRKKRRKKPEPQIIQPLRESIVCAYIRNEWNDWMESQTIKFFGQFFSSAWGVWINFLHINRVSIKAKWFIYTQSIYNVLYHYYYHHHHHCYLYLQNVIVVNSSILTLIRYDYTWYQCQILRSNRSEHVGCGILFRRRFFLFIGKNDGLWSSNQVIIAIIGLFNHHPFHCHSLFLMSESCVSFSFDTHLVIPKHIQ